MADNLLPCPFCGGRAITAQSPVLERAWRVSCTICLAASSPHATEDGAIAGWNRRLSLIEQPAQVGDVVFRAGVSTGTVIRAAQRYFQHMQGEAPAGFHQDVINLVIAAREFWDANNDLSEESRALDKALEAFGERVPYENEPDDARNPKGGGE